MPLRLTLSAPLRLAGVVCRTSLFVVLLSASLIAVGAGMGPTNGPVVPSWLKPKEKPAVRLPDTPKGWKRLDGCRLVENKDYDGDSFHVTHEGADYRFRIYFADCPETDLRHDRYIKQMTWFGVDQNRVLKYGGEAKDFTEMALRRPFTVYTLWRDARGEGATPRYYAMVYTSEGVSLAESLVKAGLARAFGEDVDFPGAGDKRRICKGLEELEAKARKGRLGIYKTGNAVLQVVSHPAPIASVAPSVPDAGKPPDAGAGKNAPVNLNSASKKELMKLPGIGDVFADRIIAARPFGSSEDVKRVAGIGPKKFEAIAPLIEAR